MINRIETQQKLMKLTKKNLAYEMTSILALLKHYDEKDDAYSAGWRESRKVIIEILDLDRFMKYENL